ncbi:MAG: NAD(P)-dependent oxidoreductase [Acidobacteriia bacterium]|nr:NAD(P)-dependent oxidoreductase [Terriglobia bacterium]
MSEERAAGVGHPDLRGKRVLVTGASGFLGANLCRTLLHAGASVHAAVRPSSELFRLGDVTYEVKIHAFDLCDREAVHRAVVNVRPTFVFHAAAHTAVHHQANVASEAADTVTATAQLLDAVAAVGCERLVHVGSSLEYGPADRPHREDDALRPSTLRGATKAAATLLVLQQAREGTVAAVVVRPFSIYGLWEPDCRLVPSAIRAAFTGEVLPLTKPGLRRDFVFVEDVCEACLCAALKDGVVGEAINLGTGRQTSNEELVALVERVTGLTVKVAVGAFSARVSDRGFWAADTGKAERLLGWVAGHSLTDGLEKTVGWFVRRTASGAGE